MYRTRITFVAAALAVFLAFPCFAADDIASTISASVADSARPATDTARDANRKPAQTMSFANIKPGAKIAEIWPGGGYYTRLLSAAVGTNGRVYALVPAPKPGGSGKDPAAPIKEIAADAHYGNVTVMPLSYTDSALNLPQKVDVVWTSDNYHDIHNDLDSLGIVEFNKRIYEALNPGGIFLITDHAAASGHGTSDTRTLHRIDPETVKNEVTAAGFQFEGKSAVLENPDDPHTAKIFDPIIRGKTDQFVMKFVKQ
jgi:predicted methyltransferase